MLFKVAYWSVLDGTKLFHKDLNHNIDINNPFSLSKFDDDDDDLPRNRISQKSREARRVALK